MTKLKATCLSAVRPHPGSWNQPEPAGLDRNYPNGTRHREAKPPHLHDQRPGLHGDLSPRLTS